MKKFWNAENIFVLLAVVFGLVFIFVTPPFQTPDEPMHFYRAYGISKGQMVCQMLNGEAGSYLPASIRNLEQSVKINDLISKTKKINFDEIKSSAKITDISRNIFIEYKNTSLYSPVGYIPQIAGIKLAQTFTHSLLLMMLAGKFFNLLLYVILGYFSLRTLPLLKWAALLILLSPMNLSLAASLSTDPMLIGISTLFFAKILQYSFKTANNIGLKQTIFLSILAIIMGLIKQNFYLAFLIFTVPKSKFKYNYLLQLLAIVVPSIAFSYIWAKIIVPVLVYGNNSNPPEQIKYILHHPLNYLFAFIKTFIRRAHIIWCEIIGVLGWLKIKLASYIYILYTLLIAVNIYFSDENKKLILPKINKALLAFAVIFFIMLIYTNMYCVWTTVGASTIIGVQGRYFAPFMLAAFAAAAQFLPTRQTNMIVQYTSVITIIITLSHALYKLYDNFYY